MELGVRSRERFDARYATFKTADNLFEQLPTDLDGVFAEVVGYVASDLAANRVFDVSEKTIRAELEVMAEAVADRFNRVQDRYFAILGKAAELEAQRKDALDNRGRVIGGGFGVEGAARGIAMAAVANAATGLLYGLANVTAKAASDLGDKGKKRDLLNDPATRADIGDFLVRVALKGCELVAATVNGRSEGMVFEPVSDESRQRSAAMVENVTAGRVAKADVGQVLVQALTIDPFNDAAWTAWLDQFGDEDGSVGSSAEALGVQEVRASKAQMVAQRKASLSWNTPEECRENAQALEQYASMLGFPFDGERALIEARAVKLDRERRTFRGVEYASVDEVDAARQAHEVEIEAAKQVREDEARRTVDGVVYDTHDAADYARTLSRDAALAASRSSNALGWMVLGYWRWRDIKGRSSRKEFWMLLLFYCVATFALAPGVDSPQEPMKSICIVSWLLLTVASLPAYLTLQIRRFHDQDRSGWLILLNLIPYVGWLIALLCMLVDGTPSDNRFGPDPKERQA